MSAVVSKNTYELLGNDPELDPSLPPPPPTKVADKPTARVGKRNEAIADRSAPRSVPGAAAADSDSRPQQDRRARTTESGRGGARGKNERGGARGGARGAARGTRDDRHSKTGIAEHEKQAARGWGANTGEGEFADEQGGLNDAHKEEAADGIVATDTAPVSDDAAAAAEPEDNTKSYEQYLAEQAEKRAALLAESKAAAARRAANEGSKTEFPAGKPLARAEDDLVKPADKKAREHRERKTKVTLELNDAWVETPDNGPRGDRGAHRGGRGGRGGDRGEGRGEFRGERGGRGGRGRGEGRGGSDRPRGEFRGGRGGAGAKAPNPTDNAMFPSLGA